MRLISPFAVLWPVGCPGFEGYLVQLQEIRLSEEAVVQGQEESRDCSGHTDASIVHICLGNTLPPSHGISPLFGFLLLASTVLLNFGSLNIHGCWDSLKKGTALKKDTGQLLRRKQASVGFLQETHLVPNEQRAWLKDWEGEASLSHNFNVGPGQLFFSPGMWGHSFSL